MEKVGRRVVDSVHIEGKRGLKAEHCNLHKTVLGCNLVLNYEIK